MTNNSEKEFVLLGGQAVSPSLIGNNRICRYLSFTRSLTGQYYICLFSFSERYNFKIQSNFCFSYSSNVIHVIAVLTYLYDMKSVTSCDGMKKNAIRNHDHRMSNDIKNVSVHQLFGHCCQTIFRERNRQNYIASISFIFLLCF